MCTSEIQFVVTSFLNEQNMTLSDKIWIEFGFWLFNQGIYRAFVVVCSVDMFPTFYVGSLLKSKWSIWCKTMRTKEH